jgi:hypothetical protein
MDLNRQIADTPSLPFDLMERADTENGVMYSTLISDKFLVSKYEGIDKLVENIHRLMSMMLIDVKHEYSQEEGEDYRLSLTASGLSLLHGLHE